MIKNDTVFKALEEWAPKHLAYDWDPIGLQIGHGQKKARKILVTLDVVEAVVDEAIEKNVKLIIAHHPFIFSPLENIDQSKAKGKVIEKLIKNDITVYAAHTNLDIADEGVNDVLTELLEIKQTKPLIETAREKLYSFVVFVPENHAESLRDALGSAGAGHIGAYSHCTYNLAGEGTFKPLEGTDPFIGEQNELSIVRETRIETIVKERDITRVIQKTQAAHPYEEMAYDLYPLKNKGKVIGLGKIGEINETISLKEFSHYVKEKLDLDGVRVTGDLTKEIKKVAILGGSGEKYYQQALEQGADVYITGDVTFHQAQDAWEAGIAIIDAGHYIEYTIKGKIKTYLETHFSGELEVIESNVNTNPFQFV